MLFAQCHAGSVFPSILRAGLEVLEGINGRQVPWDMLCWREDFIPDKEWRVEFLSLHTQSGVVTLGKSYSLIETRLTRAKDYEEIHLVSFT